MENIKSLKPMSLPRVMDLVQQAGIDVSDWSNIKSGKKNAAANPKYCYEWSYYQPGKVVVLNLWYRDLEENRNGVFRNINYRKMAERLAGKPSWHKRAGNADEYIHAAHDKGLPVRVIICEGYQRRKNDPESKSSRVTQRVLDSAIWNVSSYNKRTGQAKLTRGIKISRSDSSPVLFARIGYMKYYKGSQSGDEKPVGGGKYNKLSTGHEIFNFKDVKGKLFGYFQPYLKKSEIHRARINLEKIEPGIQDDTLDNVLVIFFSTLPDEGGQVVIGWYKQATAYRLYQESGRKHQRDNYSFNIEAETSNCALLPPESRIHQIAGKGLKQTGRPGQANAFYAYDDKGKPKSDKWIKDAIDYVENHDGRNILNATDVDTEMQRTGTQEAEKEHARSTGQAFNSSTRVRMALEKYSMAKAKLYFVKEQGYKYLRDTSKNHSYDLEFEKNGKKLHVEVKGTQTDGKTVFLTRNEVHHTNNNKNKCAIFILHSIKVKEAKSKCTCKGGKKRVILPWSINKNDIQVITYQYKVPEE